MSEFVRYVVVVHGIGEQRKNESVLSVVSRFAEACRKQDERECYDVVTLGTATSQTGKEERRGACRSPLGDSSFQPWLEFQGIPADGTSPVESFVGKPGHDGTNLRFADLSWADLMGEDYPSVGQPPDLWADGLLGRLWRKRQDADRRSRAAERPPQWALDTLGTVRETLLLLHKLLGFRTRALRDTIFVDFLGDVQLYGEYLHLRGRAVRRFHRLLSHVERWHWEGERERVARGEIRREEMREPRYTVLAHSLGTVLAMDALLYAHASVEARTGFGPERPNLPFPGYLEGLPADTVGRLRELVEDAGWSERLYARLRAGRKLPGEAGYRRPEGWPDGGPADGTAHLLRYGHLAPQGWAGRVDSFVTLGSPIDKYLALWWHNYEYLTETEWMDPVLAAERQVRKIRHFNYCDEQDPIGHHLDVAQSSLAFPQVFDVVEDVVYNRSPIPGGAHTSYWKDLPLFDRIFRSALCSKAGAPPLEFPKGFVFDPAVYDKILAITYKWIPYAVVLAGLFALTLAWYAKSWHVWPVAGLALAAILLVGRRLLDLTVAWRQVLRLKWRVEGAGGEEVARLRRQKAVRFRIGLPVRALVYLVLTGCVGGLYVTFIAVPWPKAFLVAIVAILGAVVARRIVGTFEPRSGPEARPEEPARDEERPAQAAKDSPARASDGVDLAPAEALLGGRLWAVYLGIALTLAAAVGLGTLLAQEWATSLAAAGAWFLERAEQVSGPAAGALERSRHAVLFTLAAGSGLAAAVFGYLNWRFWRTKLWFGRYGSEDKGGAMDYQGYHGRSSPGAPSEPPSPAAEGEGTLPGESRGDGAMEPAPA